MTVGNDRAMRILIVDDERSVLEFADRALRQAGYVTTLAANSTPRPRDRNKP